MDFARHRRFRNRNEKGNGAHSVFQYQMTESPFIHFRTETFQTYYFVDLLFIDGIYFIGPQDEKFDARSIFLLLFVPHLSILFPVFACFFRHIYFLFSASLFDPLSFFAFLFFLFIPHFSICLILLFSIFFLFSPFPLLLLFLILTARELFLFKNVVLGKLNKPLPSLARLWP